jgi:arginyl-tRNA synthetase
LGPVIRSRLVALLRSAIASLQAEGFLPDGLGAPVEVSEPANPEHGDFASNYALMVAKAAGKNPREIATRLAQALESAPELAAVEVAGPGFLNLRLSPSLVGAAVADVLERGEGFARLPAEQPKRLNVEFVSVNPNGPITIGSGRGAAFGSTLCNVLEAAGHTVHREYYINDGVNSEQMRLFAESVRSMCLGLQFPEKGYRGDYVAEVASKITPSGGESVGWFQARSQDLMLAKQREDLAAFGVEFDTWFSEQSLHDDGKVEAAIQALHANGSADDRPHRTKLKLGKKGVIEDVEIEAQPTDEDDAEGAGKTLWLRSTKYGDDQDRVLKRKDGRYTYIASDVAYHDDKFNRPPNADKLLTILGPDHHGYIGRLTAVVAALQRGKTEEGSGKMEVPSSSFPLPDLESRIYADAADRDACQAALAEAKEKLEVVIFQLVRFLKDGQPAPMRKRDGNIYALIDLIQEIGKAAAPEADAAEQTRIGRDVARFFYLMRSHETHLDFDLDLAAKQSDDNPVYYVQYAHARICSLLERARDAGFEASEFDESLLTDRRETALVKKIADLPFEIQRSAEDYGVHRIATYAVELARAYHHFYDGCRVIQPESPDLSRARLALCRATQVALRAAFGLLGISAPERM